MKTENLQPKDEPRTKVCPECNGKCIVIIGIAPDGSDYWEDECSKCNGTGEIIIDEP